MKITKRRLLFAGVGAAVTFSTVLVIPTAADAATRKPKRCMAQGSLSATADRQVDGEDALATGVRHVTSGSPCRDVNVRLPKGRACSSVRVRWMASTPVAPEAAGIADLPVGDPAGVGVAGLPADDTAGGAGKWRDVCAHRWMVLAAGVSEGSAYRLEVRGAAGKAVVLKVRD